MYAMQYEITLPADYDMEIVRRRVETRGRALDEFPGLGLKAYLIRERGVRDSPVNEYAPFYLWHAVSGMNRFLWGGGGFHGARRRPPPLGTGRVHALGGHGTRDGRCPLRGAPPVGSPTGRPVAGTALVTGAQVGNATVPLGAPARRGSPR